MKKITLLILALSLWTARVQATELTTVAGQPNFNLDFVQALLRNNIALGGYLRYESFLTTPVYSILARRNVRTTSAVQVFDEGGTTTSALVEQGLSIAVHESPVVLSLARGPMGEGQSVCAVMEANPGTAFVMPTGAESWGTSIDPLREPSCLAKNILIVAALDQKTGVLAYFTNYGTGVRIAAPGVHVNVTSEMGQPLIVSGTSYASTFVAAQLAVFARSYPSLRGATLIEQFFLSRTYAVPSLAGKVEGSRALDDNGF